ncbi:MAG: hypothetical protein ACREOA_01530 [Candidatus Dormibacteria bacterium]
MANDSHGGCTSYAPQRAGAVAAGIARRAHLVGLGCLGLQAAWALTLGRLGTSLTAIVVSSPYPKTCSSACQAPRSTRQVTAPQGQCWSCLKYQSLGVISKS